MKIKRGHTQGTNLRLNDTPFYTKYANFILSYFGLQLMAGLGGHNYSDANFLGLISSEFQLRMNTKAKHL